MESISDNERLFVDCGEEWGQVVDVQLERSIKNELDARFKNSEKSNQVSRDTDNLETEFSTKSAKLNLNPPYSAFPTQRRNLILLIVTLAGFLGPLSGNVYIPILPLMAETFKVSPTAINGTVSVFMAVFAVAPLMWASMADFGGRKNLYLISVFIFLIANVLIIVVSNSIVALYILRAVQAFGASSVISLGIGTFVDIVEPKNRGKAISIFMLGPQLGPIIGPLFSLSASGGKWKWTFGILIIIGGIVYIGILFLVPETLRYLVGNGEVYKDSSWIVAPKLYQKRIIDDPGFTKPPKPGIKVYLRLIKYPPVILCSINSALLFASFYALNVSYTTVLKDYYNYSELQQSLSYLCPGFSLICGSMMGGYMLDKFRGWKTAHSSGFVPEDSFIIQTFGFLCALVGLCCYGWMISNHKPVASVFVFVFVSGFGMTWVFVTSNAYLSEAVKGQPATAIALANCLRNIAAAISSSIIHKLSILMGYGWCFTGLALLNIITISIVVLLFYKGRMWRETS